MELKSIKSKKAQGYTTTELMVMIAVIITVVIIVYGFYKGWDYIFGKIGILPDTLEVVVQVCSQQKTSTAQDYCLNFREVSMDGKTQRVTCGYLKQVRVTSLPDIDCSEFNVAKSANATCINLKLKSSSVINGKTCEEWNAGIAPAIVPPNTVQETASTLKSGTDCDAKGGQWLSTCKIGTATYVDLTAQISDQAELATNAGMKCCHKTALESAPARPL